MAVSYSGQQSECHSAIDQFCLTSSSPSIHSRSNNTIDFSRMGNRRPSLRLSSVIMLLLLLLITLLALFPDNTSGQKLSEEEPLAVEGSGGFNPDDEDDIEVCSL